MNDREQLYECPNCGGMIDIHPCLAWEDTEFKVICPDCTMRMEYKEGDTE